MSAAKLTPAQWRLLRKLPATVDYGSEAAAALIAFGLAHRTIKLRELVATDAGRAALHLVIKCERCGRTALYERSIDPDIPAWVHTLSQSHCDQASCDTGDTLIETWLDADGVARDPAEVDAGRAALQPEDRTS
jgi:hypothetical protein